MRFLGRLIFPSRASAPASPENGEVWYDSVLAKFRARQGGTTVDLIAGAAGAIPIGGEITYYGATAPSGGDWLFPLGQEVPIADYPDAYDTFTSGGTVFPYGPNTNGSGVAGSTHFRMPDGRGLTRVQKNDGRTGAQALTGTDSVGTIGGTQRHALAQGEMPPHDHADPTNAGWSKGARANFTGINGNYSTQTINVDHWHTHTDRTRDHWHLTNGATAAADNAFGGVATGTAQNRAAAQHSHSVTGSSTGWVNNWTGGNFTEANLGTSWAINNADPTADGNFNFALSFNPASLSGSTWQNEHMHPTVRAGSASGAVNSAAGDSHENMQPHMRVNKLIRMR
jgi:microcystin-dependent protein